MDRRIGIISINRLNRKAQQLHETARWMIVLCLIFAGLWLVSGSEYPRFFAAVTFIFTALISLAGIAFIEGANDALIASLEVHGLSEIQPFDSGVFFACYRGERVKVRLVSENSTRVSIWIRPAPTM